MRRGGHALAAEGNGLQATVTVDDCALRDKPRLVTRDDSPALSMADMRGRAKVKNLAQGGRWKSVPRVRGL